MHVLDAYLTISRRRRGGDYKLVFAEPEATTCVSINFQVDITSLNRKTVFRILVKINSNSCGGMVLQASFFS